MFQSPAKKSKPLAAAASAALMLIAAGSLVALAATPATAKTKPKPRSLSGKNAVAKTTTSTALNINTAGKPELAPLAVLSSQAKWAIANFRAGGPYLSGADFATKVCSRVAVDFGATDILIGTTTYQGFKCAVPASGTYLANGSSHTYPIAVEITGSATIPPAPPAQ